LSAKGKAKRKFYFSKQKAKPKAKKTFPKGESSFEQSSCITKHLDFCSRCFA
jgi:hypothetical protein